MALYESKYGTITQTDESTYMIGNYQIVAVEDSWKLSPVAMPSSKTWLQSSAVFNTLEDAIRVAVVFSKEDGLANGLKDMLMMFTTRRSDSEHGGKS